MEGIYPMFNKTLAFFYFMWINIWNVRATVLNKRLDNTFDAVLFQSGNGGSIKDRFFFAPV